MALELKQARYAAYAAEKALEEVVESEYKGAKVT